LVGPLRYKPEGRGFDSLWQYCPRVDTAFHISEEREYFLGDKSGRCVGLTTLPLSCADCREIWETQTSGILWASNRDVQGLTDLYLYLYIFTVLRLICGCSGQSVRQESNADWRPHSEEEPEKYDPSFLEDQSICYQVFIAFSTTECMRARARVRVRVCLCECVCVCVCLCVCERLRV